MRLRKYKEEDASHVLSWFKEPTTFYMWSADKFGKYPITADEFNTFYERMKRQSGTFQAFLVENDTGERVAHFFLWKVNDTDTNIRLGFLVVNAVYRGKGFLREAMELAKEYARGIGMKELTLGVFENNEHARKCYEALGFEYYEGAEHNMQIGDENWLGYEMHMKLV